MQSIANLWITAERGNVLLDPPQRCDRVEKAVVPSHQRISAPHAAAVDISAAAVKNGQRVQRQEPQHADSVVDRHREGARLEPCSSQAR